MRKTTIYLDEEDDKQITKIRKEAGLLGDAAAIRLAIRHYSRTNDRKR